LLLPLSFAFSIPALLPTEIEERRKIEGIVEARTSELKDINKKLIEEIDVRKTAENAFRENEER
jgi:C4-dicarboxylate-specific signal transduction histidine kinase